MKILFISNLLPPNFIGGYEIACYDTYKLFKKNNLECAILTSDFILNDSISINTEHENKESIFRLLKIHTDFKNNTNCPSYLQVEKHNINVLTDFIKHYKPNIVYYWNLWGLGSKIIKCFNAEKSIFHIMDFSIKLYDFSLEKYLKFIFLQNRHRPIYIKSDLKNTIFISNFVSEKFSNYNIKRKKTIYPFLQKFNTDMVKKSYQNELAIFRGVFIGQIERHKGILDLCYVLESINNQFGFKKVSIDIYGSSQSNLANFIREKFKFVTIIEKKPRIQILQLLKSYDFGFFPSLWDEPFGIAQIEMMAAGLPVLSSAKGGSCEPLNAKNSIIYHDFNELKKLLLSFLLDYNSIAQQLGENAQNEIALNYNETAYFDNIISFFNDVLINK